MNKEDVEKAQKGDKKAFEKIIMEVIDSLYRVAYGILENQEDASDAISNATLKAYEKIKTLRQAEFFKTWITKILINECNAIIIQKKNILVLWMKMAKCWEPFSRRGFVLSINGINQWIWRRFWNI